jgi:hypothetical protein
VLRGVDMTLAMRLPDDSYVIIYIVLVIVILVVLCYNIYCICNSSGIML